jgi:hypothetical protein
MAEREKTVAVLRPECPISLLPPFEENLLPVTPGTSIDARQKPCHPARH